MRNFQLGICHKIFITQGFALPMYYVNRFGMLFTTKVDVPKCKANAKVVANA